MKGRQEEEEELSRQNRATLEQQQVQQQDDPGDDPDDHPMVCVFCQSHVLQKLGDASGRQNRLVDAIWQFGGGVARHLGATREPH